MQICMLDLVLKLLPEDSKEPQTARILLYKLFYDQTDQGMTQFLLNLLKSFNTHKQPRRYFPCHGSKMLLFSVLCIYDCILAFSSVLSLVERNLLIANAKYVSGKSNV